ncbi:MAG: hypothetical protein M1828_004574 [Chrysothrix sp. TS-e1954]|nr:MAG: hypothetical protein M1828_004574 [Chrysothrix sp. TS-e1954]
MASRRANATADPAPAKEFDPEIVEMAKYVHNYKVDSDLAFETARYVFLDTLGCGLRALEFPQCAKLLGPVVPGTTVPHGSRVPGTSYQLDPVLGAFNIGAMIRWLDFNDCWLAAEWGHPSDNLGAILSVADWISRTNRAGMSKLGDGKVLKIKDVLEAMIKAHELQGVLALENSFNKVGLDHVVLVKVASTAVVAKMMGLTEAQTRDAVTQAWCDGQSMRTYRHTPNTMSRKSWAAGDACEKAVNLVLKVMKGEGGMATVLSAPTWGFYDVNFKGQKFKFQRPYGSYVMENVLFKVSYPAEFHSQTAIEAAKRIKQSMDKMGKTAADIESITNRTHEACIRIIDKQFKPMDNYADRDHCVQYMCAVMLVFGRLEAGDYTDGGEAASSPLVEDLRKRIACKEDLQFTKDYHDPEKRTIANALTVRLNDGTILEEEVVEAPLGHRLRREEAKPEIMEKYRRHLLPHFDQSRVDQLVKLGMNKAELEGMDVDKYVDLYEKSKSPTAAFDELNGAQSMPTSSTVSVISRASKALSQRRPSIFSLRQSQLRSAQRPFSTTYQRLATMPTECVYLDDSTITNHATTLTSVTPIRDVSSSTAALLKLPPDSDPNLHEAVLTTRSTAFHPQGGGQPSDTGTIALTNDKDVTFEVKAARKQVEPPDAGTVLHHGRFSDADAMSAFQANPDAPVLQQVNAAKRLLHSRIHDGGHVLGLAVRSLSAEITADSTSPVPISDLETKAQHYPGAAHVEFHGLIPGHWKDRIQAACNEIVAQDRAIHIKWCANQAEVEELQVITTPETAAEFFKRGERMRVAEIEGVGCYNCGGTHVARTGEVGEMKVRKISRQKGMSRVSYEVV